jgi:hypothetical protein
MPESDESATSSIAESPPSKGEGVEMPLPPLYRTLDYDLKGWVTVDDVLSAFFAVGCEPSPNELAPVLDECQANLSSPAPSDSELQRLLLKYKIKTETIAARLAFWKAHDYIERPADDPFTLWSSPSLFFWTRLAITMVPILLLVFARTNVFLPSTTPYEKSVYNITRDVLGTFVAVLTAIAHVSFGLSLLDMIPSLPPKAFVVPLIWPLILDAALANREAHYTCSSTTIKRSPLTTRWKYERFVMFSTRFSVSENVVLQNTRSKEKKEVSGLVMILSMLRASRTFEEMEPFLSVPHHHTYQFYAEYNEGRTRRSSVGELEQFMLEHTTMESSKNELHDRWVPSNWNFCYYQILTQTRTGTTPSHSALTGLPRI